MKRFAMVSAIAVTVIAGGTASLKTAEAWWGWGGPWNNSGWGDTGGDFSMNFSGRGSGTGYGSPYYGGYGPGGPGYWGGGPGYWGGGYPGYWGGGYPGAGSGYYGGGYGSRPPSAANQTQGSNN